MEDALVHAQDYVAQQVGFTPSLVLPLLDLDMRLLAFAPEVLSILIELARCHFLHHLFTLFDVLLLCLRRFLLLSVLLVI